MFDKLMISEQESHTLRYIDSRETVKEYFY